MRTLAKVIGSVAIAAGIWLGASDARADARPLTKAELERLEHGETVVREQTVPTVDGDSHLVGGVAYTIVDAAPDEVLSLFADEAAYMQILPRTKNVRRVAQDGPDDEHVEITQGNSVVSTSYTLHVRKYARENTVRFWMDPAYAHGIDDAWGFVRAESIPTASGAPRTLVTYGALVDIGPGIVRALYEERLRAAMLSVPQLLRAYVARTSRAAHRA